ncbi:hypothetical protein CEXT_618901 [Caerostris extrusa]|uniref:Secreted protein n=1 Tax=Caerostris extrusa TaxID=172846 RepID=A0AAV4T0Q1_CAEEX|nr:hypothetical protein CEXT_618901 [Caerostris extrusa]
MEDLPIFVAFCSLPKNTVCASSVLLCSFLSLPVLKIWLCSSHFKSYCSTVSAGSLLDVNGDINFTANIPLRSLAVLFLKMVCAKQIKILFCEALRIGCAAACVFRTWVLCERFSCLL